MYLQTTGSGRAIHQAVVYDWFGFDVGAVFPGLRSVHMVYYMNTMIEPETMSHLKANI